MERCRLRYSDRVSGPTLRQLIGFAVMPIARATLSGELLYLEPLWQISLKKRWYMNGSMIPEGRRRALVRRAMVWELFAGLFGWIYLLGILATLVFLGMAAFSSGSWWHALYAFIVSSVGKWLARGCGYNKSRAILESNLLQRK